MLHVFYVIFKSKYKIFQERSKTFITAENIDEAIERALANHVDYNFAIDTEGNRYIGRSARPGKTPPQQVSEMKAQAQN